MRIGIDIDNVISKFNEKLLDEYLIYDKSLRGNGIINSNADYITKGMFDWSKEESEEFYRDNIEKIAYNLDTVDNASEYIKKLREIGHEIYIISGRDNGEYSDPYKMTIEWLNKNDIEYDKLILTNSNNAHEKTKACIDDDISIMIDDSARVCIDTNKYGIMTLIMDTPFNRKVNNIKRVYDWKEIYDFVINYKKKKINVILDTDTYNECDDQFALAYMLKNQDLFNIEAITVAPYSHKNCTVIQGRENSYNEIIKICKWSNFDTTNRVFLGAEDYICNGCTENNDAANKIIHIGLNNDKTYIIAIGALTNVALAIKKEPKIIEKMEIIWLGGHSLLQKNNLEYNFKQDIEAVKIVFNSKIKLTVIPCKNVASNLVTSIYELNYYLKDKNELCNYLINKFHDDGYHGIQERRIIWDISAVAYLINKSWFEIDEISCPNINVDTSYEITDNKHKITMISYINVNKVYSDLFKKLGDLDEINK